jgi:hypothetical protein
MPDLFFNFWPIQERMNSFVRIEKYCDRQKFAQTLHERAFTRGNPTRYPDCRHDSGT